MPDTKETFVDIASGGAWTSRTRRQFSRTGINGNIPGGIDNVIGIFETSSPYMIGIIGDDTPCGIKFIQEVDNIRQSTSQGLVRKPQKLDTAVDGKFSDNRNSTSI